MTKAQRKLFLVLDLNGTLMARVKEQKESHMKLNKRFSVMPSSGDLVFVRPHVRDLANYLHEEGIRYAFWTTAMEHNGVHLVDIATRNGLDMPEIKLYHSHSNKIPGHPYKRCKDLEVVSRMAQVPLEHIRLVDDEEMKAVQKDQLIQIKPYCPKEEKDDALLQLVETLKKIN